MQKLQTLCCIYGKKTTRFYNRFQAGMNYKLCIIRLIAEIIKIGTVRPRCDERKVLLDSNMNSNSTEFSLVYGIEMNFQLLKIVNAHLGTATNCNVN